MPRIIKLLTLFAGAIVVLIINSTANAAFVTRYGTNSAVTAAQSGTAYSWSSASGHTTDAATTDSVIESVSAVDQDGNTVTVDLSDVSGLTSDWLTAAGYDADKSTVKVTLDDSGAVTKFSLHDESDNIVASYDPDTRQMTFYHTSGDLKGKAEYTTSESETGYTWRYSDYDREDPGKGDDGHVITQYYNYDSDGNLNTVEYFTWTAGNRAKTNDTAMYSRYMYMVDTYDSNGDLTDTVYYNDPRPSYWEPTITGTVGKDSSGRYYIEAEDGTIYVFTATKDGFDADGDGTSGAEEVSAVDWESYVGKEITLRGQEIADANGTESDLYINGEKAQGFEVVDVIETDESLIEGWEDIAEAATEAWASLNDEMTMLGNETDIDKVYNKLYSGLADNLKEAGIDSSDIRKFADSDMKSTWADKNPDFSSYTTISSISAKAIEYLNDGNWNAAEAFANEMILRYKTEAQSQQSALSAYPASGSEDVNKELNAVGSAYWILGSAYNSDNESVKAKEALNTLIDDYKYAMILDEDGTTWKKLKEKAEELLNTVSGN